MTPEQVAKLRHGLYRIFWTSGGDSLAAVGSDREGKRWLAPTNWVGGMGATDNWHEVERVDLITVYEPPNRSEHVQETSNIELTPDEAHALLDKIRTGEWSSHNRAIVAKVEAAVEKSNPLNTPWTAVNSHASGWFVRGHTQNFAACAGGPMREAQAKLIAAAPELADALEAMLRWVHEHGWRNSAAMREASEALAKAGRR